MKKIILAFLFILPFSLNAQLDKLHQGMNLEEFHKKFPSAIPDLDAMTCRIYKKDTLLGVVGESQFIAVKDSVNRYSFRSVSFTGPCNAYPKADSIEYLRVVRAAQELSGHYSDMFGTPTEQKSISPRSIPDGSEEHLFIAEWKRPDATVRVSIHKVITIENMINAPITESRDKKKKSCDYVMEVTAEGKWTKLRIDFEIGITKNQFRALMPALASQVKDFPDCWMMKDTLGRRDAEWHFWFVENTIAGFSFDSYNGDSYSGTNKSAYPVLLNKAKQLTAEEQKSYGSPTLLQVPPTDAYVPVKKVPTAFFYDDIYYNAEWEMDKGKILFIRLHENGGKGESFLHLEVFYGEKEN